PDGTATNVTLLLEDGRRIAIGDLPRIYGGGPWTYGQTLPAAQHIELVGPSGAAVPIAPADVVAVDKALDTMLPEIVRAQPMMPLTPNGGGGGCACGLGGRDRTGATIGLLLGLGAFAARQSRRRR